VLSREPVLALSALDRGQQSSDLTFWFQRKWFQPLEEGEKTGTLRRGRRVPWGVQLLAVERETSLVRGVVHVEELAWLAWREVPQRRDILAHEYPKEWGALKREMETVYPGLSADEWVSYYRIKYESMLLRE
jgi:hypothetical protein